MAYYIDIKLKEPLAQVVKRADPYHNPIFTTVLYNVYFKNPKLLGRKCTKLFCNSLDDGNTDKVEIPPMMLVLVATAICLSVMT